MKMITLLCLFVSLHMEHCSGVTLPPPAPEADLAPPFLKHGSEECEDKATCSGELTYPDKNCFCDAQCYVADDCCKNIHEVVPEPPDVLLDKSQFMCSRMPGLVMTVDIYGVFVVAKCHASWTDNGTRSLCEGNNFYFTENVLMQTPVSDINHIMYRNMYCAYCNYEYNILFWLAEYRCVNETGVRTIPGSPDCILRFDPPSPIYTKRLCPLIPPVESCNHGAETEVKENCSAGPFNIVYNDFDGSISYKNEYCAQCNGLPKDRIWCEKIIADILPTATEDPRAPKYSYRLLVDLNSQSVDVNGTVRDQDIQCQDNEIYDFLEEACREIFCVSPAVAVAGRCIIEAYSDGRSADRDNCTWVKFTSGEYRLFNNSALFILSQAKVYREENFRKNGTDVFICLKRNQSCLHNCERTGVKPTFDETESLLSFIGLIISLASLSITFIIYVSFPQLLNTPGKILLCLVVSLWVAQLLFLTSSEAEDIRALCTAFAIGIHYFFLAAFCWMNVIAFDLWMTFSNSFRATGSGNRSAKRLRLYHIYAWFVPLLIVCVAIALDFIDVDLGNNNFKPGYGRDVCWIHTREALLLFFVGPLALLKLIDIVSFIFTAVHIAKAKRQGAMARQKKNTCSLLINIKLSLVMGLTWVFAFIANATNLSVFWYLFIVFNTLQGLFIALSFLCTKKVWRLIHDRYDTLTSSFTSKSTSGTHSTNLSKST